MTKAYVIVWGFYYAEGSALAVYNCKKKAIKDIKEHRYKKEGSLYVDGKNWIRIDEIKMNQLF